MTTEWSRQTSIHQRGYRVRVYALKGVTLVELLITLAIAAILLTVGVPSFQSIVTNNRLVTASNDVLLGLSVAKSEAIRRNAAIRFCLNPTTLTWKVVTMTNTDIRAGSLPNDITATTSDDEFDETSVADHECVLFSSDGLPYKEKRSPSNLISNGSITLTLLGKNRVINIRTGALNVVSS